MSNPRTKEALFEDLVDVISRHIYWYQGGAVEALNALLEPENIDKLDWLVAMIEVEKKIKEAAPWLTR